MFTVKKWLLRRREEQQRQLRLEIARQIDEYAQHLSNYDESVVGRTIAVLLRDNALQFVLKSLRDNDYELRGRGR